MNKGDLIDAVAEKTGESRAGAQRMVDAVISAIIEGVRKEKRVTIPRFGTFSEKHRKGRTVRNPATNLPIEIKPCVTMGFTASHALKEQGAEVK